MHHKQWTGAHGVLLALLLVAGVLVTVGVSYGDVPGAVQSAPRRTATPPPGCWEPPDDYSRVWVGGVQLNARTLAMLDHAQKLYGAQGGVIELRRALTQGSYNAGGVAASFGTHDGGGAVDIAVRSPATWDILYDELDPLIRALRVAGFAAWVRETGELYPNSPIHIHAIAVGDRELSEAARAQIVGRFGYLRGYNGLPQANGMPLPDRYGDPVICEWMVARGFDDMRGLPNPYPTPGGTTVPLRPIP